MLLSRLSCLSRLSRSRSTCLALFVAPTLAVGLLLLWLHLPAIAQPAIAQPPDPVDGQAHQILFTYSDGLVANSVTAMLRDDRSLWVGTRAGLSRHTLRGQEAGLVWQTFTRDDGMADDAVSDLWADDEGGLWVAHPGGQISLLDGGRWTTYANLTETLELAYDLIVERDVTSPLWAIEEGGRVWMLNRGTVGYYVGAVWRPYGQDAGIPRGRLVYVWTGQEGAWVASESGQIGYFDGANWTIFGSAFDAVQRQYETIVADAPTASPVWLVDQEKAVWVRNAFNGRNPNPDVRRFAEGSWTNFGTRNGMASGFVAELRLDGFGRVWARHAADADGEGGGLSLYEEESWTAIRPAVSGNVTDFWPEGTDAVWVGSFYQPEAGGPPIGGLTYIALNTWQRYALETLGGGTISDSWLDEEDDLWLGLSSGLMRYRPTMGERSAQWTPVEGLLDDDVRDLWGDGRGNLWIATAEGINRIELEGKKRFTYTLPLGPDQIAGDGQGEVWAVALGQEGGLWQWDGRTWASHTVSDGLSGGVYADALGVADGQLYLAGDRGLEIWDGEEWETFGALPGRHVKQLWQDSAGDLWLSSEVTPGQPFNLSFNQRRERTWETVLTADESRVMGTEPLALLRDHRDRVWLGTPLGLFVYQIGGEGQWHGLGPAEGLPTDPVPALYEDPGGTVWVAMGEQVYRTDGWDWHRFAPQVGTVGHIAAGPDGRVLLAGDAGVALYNPLYPELRLDGVVNLTSGQAVDGKEPVVLTIGRNAIQIELSAIAPALPPRQLAYRYRLQGFDEGWRLAPAQALGGKRATINYAGLPAGVYTFTAAVRNDVLDYSPDVRFELYVLSQAPTLALDRATVAGRPARDPGTLQAYVEQPIHIQLQTEDDQPGELTFRYQIEGLSDAWTETARPEISFTLAAAGTYTFVASALDAEGQPSPLVGSQIVVRERQKAQGSSGLPVGTIATGLGVISLLFILAAVVLIVRRRRRESW